MFLVRQLKLGKSIITVPYRTYHIWEKENRTLITIDTTGDVRTYSPKKSNSMKIFRPFEKKKTDLSILLLLQSSFFFLKLTSFCKQ